MRNLTKEAIYEIIDKHKHFLHKDCPGWRDMRADLSDVDLSGVVLKSMELRAAILCGADLSEAVLIDVDLSNADLRDVSFKGSVILDSDMRRAILSGADFTYSAISCTDLSSTNLSETYLGYAEIHNTDLQWSILGDNVIPLSCPEQGSFIGFKKAGGKIVVLEIMEDAKRLSSTKRQCRCDKARVLRIENLDGTISNLKCVSSDFDRDFEYVVGETVSVDKFDDDRWEDCTSGIHFFINRSDAVNYC